MTEPPPWTLGVEEEYQIIDLASRELKPRAYRIITEASETLGDEVQSEMKQSQIEFSSPVCGTLAEVRAALTDSRATLIDAASRSRCAIGAAGTHPFSDWHMQPVTPTRRYMQMMQEYQRLAGEQIIFGCHVHIGLEDREMAIRIMNRARNWLFPLLALAANSPFWSGEDTGYASFRTFLWIRWPMAGPPLPFASYQEYRSLLQALVDTHSIDQPTRIYWDIRLPEHIDTIEFRVADVCLTVDEAVMIAGLTRALVRTCYEQVVRDDAFTLIRPELVRMAHWRAARYGLEGDLIDVTRAEVLPAREVVDRFMAFVNDALEAEGDKDEVAHYVHQTLERGNGAQRQRAAFEKSGKFDDVIDLIVRETAKGLPI